MREVFKSRILKLADTIEHSPELKKEKIEFDFGSFVREYECKTVACIAGFAIMQKSRKKSWMARARELIDYMKVGYGGGLERIVNEAGDYLGLDIYDRRSLFYGLDFEGDTRITHRRAAAVLRNFVKTGQIDWNIKRLKDA